VTCCVTVWAASAYVWVPVCFVCIRDAMRVCRSADEIQRADQVGRANEARRTNERRSETVAEDVLSTPVVQAAGEETGSRQS